MVYIKFVSIDSSLEERSLGGKYAHISSLTFLPFVYQKKVATRVPKISVVNKDKTF